MNFSTSPSNCPLLSFDTARHMYILFKFLSELDPISFLFFNLKGLSDFSFMIKISGQESDYKKKLSRMSQKLLFMSLVSKKTIISYTNFRSVGKYVKYPVQIKSHLLSFPVS